MFDNPVDLIEKIRLCEDTCLVDDSELLLVIPAATLT